MSANHPIPRRLIVLGILVAPWVTLAIRTAVLDYRDRQTREPVAGVWRPMGEIRYAGVPLDRVLADLCARAHVRIDADWQRLRPCGIHPETPVTLRLVDVPLAVVLRNVERLVDPAHFTLAGDHVLMSVRADTKPTTPLTLRAYDVRFFASAAPGPMSGATRKDEIDTLLALVTHTIDPGSWQDASFNPSSIVNTDAGPGYIACNHGVLFVWQTPENQFLVADLIRKLPRLLRGDAREQPVRLVHSPWEKP